MVDDSRKIHKSRKKITKFPKDPFEKYINIQIDFGIVTALTLELKAMIDHMSCVKIIKKDNHTYYFGNISTYNIVVVKSLNTGSNDAAAVTSDLIKDWDPFFILKIGIAAGFKKNLELGDVVISNQIFVYDYTKEFDNHSKTRPEAFRSDPNLLESVQIFSEDWDGKIDVESPQNYKQNSNSFISPVAAGNKLLASEKEFKKIKDIHDKILAVEMESGGVATVAHQHNRGVMIISGISDYGDGNKNDDWHEYSSKAAATFFADLLNSGIISINHRNSVLDTSFESSDESFYINVGIKSFSRRTEEMENKTDIQLSLLKFFEGRYIKAGYNWNYDIYPLLNDFILTQIVPDYKYKLYLAAHLSIAFVSGYLLDSKTGIEIYPMQKTSEKEEFWYPQKNLNQTYPEWEVNEIILSEDGNDVALVIGVTYDIFGEVYKHIKNKQIDILKIINCKVGGRTGHDVIADGYHAKKLAIAISTILKQLNPRGRRNRLHIFASCPVGFSFYLGKVSRSFGRTILYENDFDDCKDELYFSSFELPYKESKGGN